LDHVDEIGDPLPVREGAGAQEMTPSPFGRARGVRVCKACCGYNTFSLRPEAHTQPRRKCGSRSTAGCGLKKQEPALCRQEVFLLRGTMRHGAVMISRSRARGSSQQDRLLRWYATSERCSAVAYASLMPSRHVLASTRAYPSIWPSVATSAWILNQCTPFDTSPLGAAAPHQRAYSRNRCPALEPAFHVCGRDAQPPCKQRCRRSAMQDRRSIPLPSNGTPRGRRSLR
jgi:hypothetical protein